MTNQEIYAIALRLASEVGTVGINTDYEERAGYLLAVLCQRYAPLDGAYRTANKLGKATIPNTVPFSLSSVFPLADALSAPVAASLAALLVTAESPTLADRLDRLAADAASALRQSLPCSVEAITDRYAQA